MNWPNFAASPALLGWPARNRHTAACIRRFSHIFGRPPEPVVWFMSESRAVANEHEGYKRTLSIISSSFWMAVGVKGLMFHEDWNLFRMLLTLFVSGIVVYCWCHQENRPWEEGGFGTKWYSDMSGARSYFFELNKYDMSSLPQQVSK